MAIYHLSSQIIGRSDNRSVVAAAAYRSGEALQATLSDIETGIEYEKKFDYTKKSNVVCSEIIAPAYAPKWVYNREQLWNEVERVEKRKDAQLAREIDVAFPKELNLNQSKELIREYIGNTFVNKGMIADYAIHWEEGNPHAHILLTMCEITKGGFGLKNTDWNKKEFLKEVRESWSKHANLHLERYGIDTKIDHRSYKEQGINLTPTIHEGVQKFLGGWLQRKEINEEIRANNLAKINATTETIIEKISQNKTTFTKADIASEIFNLTLGDDKLFYENFEAVMNAKNLQKVIDKDIKGETRYTNKSYAALEEKLWQKVGALLQTTHNNKSLEKAYSKLVDTDNIKELSQEQRLALKGVIRGNNLNIIIGRAGSGKTTLLGTLANVYEKGGYRVRGGAISGIATDNLAGQDSTKIDSRTLAKWIKDLEEGREKFGKKDVFILDEASMVDVATMKKIVGYLEKAKAKLVLVGDDTQIQPIDKGAAFRGILSVAPNSSVFKLEEIWRQREKWQKEATRLMAKGDIGNAAKIYNEKGFIDWNETQEQAIAKLTKAYVKDYLVNNIKPKIAITYTGEQANNINKLVRQDLRKAEILGEEKQYLTSTGYKDIAVGEKIIFLANNSEIKLRNGTLATVTSIKDNKISIIISDNRKISFDPRDYRDFDYGYAITTHKAQGITVDKSYVLLEEYHKFNSFNVAVTRHRDSLSIYTDKETFRDLDTLVSKLEKEEMKELIADYKVEDKNKAEYQTFTKYISCMEKARGIYAGINEWAERNNQPALWHRTWKDYLSIVKERESLAKVITDNKGDYRLYLTQSNISFSSVEGHAGKRVYKETEQDLAYKEVANQYLASKSPALAYIISKDIPSFARAIRNLDIKEINQLAKQFEKELGQESNTSILGNYAELNELRNKQTILRSDIKVIEANSEKEKSREIELDYQNKLVETKIEKLYSSKTEEVLEKWNTLTGSNITNIMEAAKDIQNNPSILGELAAAKLSISQRTNLASSLVSYSNNNLELAKLNDKIKLEEQSKYLTNKYEELNKVEEGLGVLSRLPKTLNKIIDSLEKNRSGKKISTKEKLVDTEILSTTKELVKEQVRNNNISNNTELQRVLSGLEANVKELAFELLPKVSSGDKFELDSKKIKYGSSVIELKGAKAGLWHRFASGEGGNLINLISKAESLDIANSIKYAKEWLGMERKEVDYANLVSNEHKTKENVKENWERIEAPNGKELKVADIEKEFSYRLKNHTLEAIYEYRSKDNLLEGYVARYKNHDTGERITPMVSYCKNKVTGEERWKEKGFGDERCLYGEYKLPENKDILIVEGEKTADVAQKLFPEYSVISWSGGAASIAKARFSLIENRNVIIWPDNDKPGFKAAKKIKEIISRDNNVITIDPNKIIDNLPEKWDLADNLPENITIEDVKQKLFSIKEAGLNRSYKASNEILSSPDHKGFISAISSDLFYQRQMKRIDDNFKKIYANPDIAKDNWVKLEQQIGLAAAKEKVRANPEMLGKIAGTNVLGIKSKTREEADEFKMAIHDSCKVYSEALKASKERSAYEQLIENKYLKPVEQIETKDKTYEELSKSIYNVTHKAVPAIEGDIQVKVIEDVLNRMLELIANHKLENGYEPTSEEIKSFFFRSKFEAMRQQHYLKNLDKALSIREYCQKLTEINRLARIEGKLYMRDYVQQGRDPLQFRELAGGLDRGEYRYHDKALNELQTRDKDFTLLTNHIAKQIDLPKEQKAITTDLLLKYHESFDKMPSQIQIERFKEIATSIDKSTSKLLQSGISQEEAKYITNKETSEIYIRSAGKTIITQDTMLESKKSAMKEYNVLKQELEYETKQLTLEKENSLAKQLDHIKERDDR